MNNSYTNIGLACGGTGGHISPALAISTNFKDFKLKLYFLLITGDQIYLMLIVIL